MSGEKKFDLLTYYEIIDRPKVALTFLGLMVAATSLIGGVLYFKGYSSPGLILLGFSAITILLIIFNLKGQVRTSIAGLLWLFPGVFTILMIEGEGLHDPGMIGFGLYVIVAALLMGKRFLPAAWAISAAMMVFIYLAENLELFAWTESRHYTSSPVDLIIVLVILTVGTAVFWIVMDIIEETISKLVWSENQIKEAYDLTLEGWSRALEMRDKETQGHSRRVTNLTLKIGKRMGFTQDELFHIRRGALLHDIGKMAISDNILHKPGSLDEEEWEIVRQHPGYAYEMLKDIEFLIPALEIPLYHHERWDGNGYPNGLTADEIPLSARIFTVVDNWDALHSNRPYRTAWKQADVIDYFKQESGKKFDPEIINLFLSLLEADYTMC